MKGRRWLNTDVKQPDSCSDEDIAAFCVLVRKGDEVQPRGLEGRVRRAKALAFLRVDSKLVGVAALKRPRVKYRSDIFEKAAASQESALFGLELGWVYVLPECRGSGYSVILALSAESQSGGVPIFATTRADNMAMRKTLERLNFRRTGNPFYSTRDQSKLLLYVKSSG